MTQRDWQAAFAIGGLVLVAAWCVQTIACHAAHGQYDFHHHYSVDGPVASPVDPIEGLVKGLAVVVAELAIGCVVIARVPRVWAACLVLAIEMWALFVALCVCVLTNPPPYVVDLGIYQAFGGVWLLASTFVTGVWAALHEVATCPRVAIRPQAVDSRGSPLADN